MKTMPQKAGNKQEFLANYRPTVLFFAADRESYLTTAPKNVDATVCIA